MLHLGLFSCCRKKNIYKKKKKELFMTTKFTTHQAKSEMSKYNKDEDISLENL